MKSSMKYGFWIFSVILLQSLNSAFALNTDFACADPAVQKSINSRQVAEWGAPLWEKVHFMRYQTEKSIQEKKRKIADIEAKLPQLKKEALAQIKEISELSAKKVLKSLLWTDEAIKLPSKLKNKKENVDVENAMEICNEVAAHSDQAFSRLAYLYSPRNLSYLVHGLKYKDRYYLEFPELATYSWNSSWGAPKAYQITEGSKSTLLKFPEQNFDPAFDVAEIEIKNNKVSSFGGLTQNDEGDFKFREYNLVFLSAITDLTETWSIFGSEKRRLSKLKESVWSSISNSMTVYSHTRDLVEQAFERMWLEKEISFDRAILAYLERWQASLDKYDNLCRNAYAANVWRRTDAILSQSKLPNSMSISDEGMKSFIETSASVGARPDESFYKEYGSKDAR